MQTVLSLDTALDVPNCRALLRSPDPRVRDLAIAALRRVGEAVEVEEGGEVIEAGDGGER